MAIEELRLNRVVHTLVPSLAAFMLEHNTEGKICLV